MTVRGIPRKLEASPQEAMSLSPPSSTPESLKALARFRKSEGWRERTKERERERENQRDRERERE